MSLSSLAQAIFLPFLLCYSLFLLPLEKNYKFLDSVALILKNLHIFLSRMFLCLPCVHKVNKTNSLMDSFELTLGYFSTIYEFRNIEIIKKFEKKYLKAFRHLCDNVEELCRSFKFHKWYY